MENNYFNQKYVNIHISIKEELFELAYAYLQDFRFTGIEEKLDELVISFESIYWTDDTKKNLLQALKLIDNSIIIQKEVFLADENWNEEWEKNVPAIIVNERIGIAPAWKVNELNNEIKIIINPKMSFGTGQHATTRMVCKLMEEFVLPGSSWLDAGCGTGILSVLAIKLGADKVLAFDYNDWAIENAKENFLLNQVDSNIELIKADIDTIVIPQCNGIVANLYRHLLIPSFPKFYNSIINNEGHLIVSGILKYDLAEILEAAVNAGFHQKNTIIEDEWVAIVFEI